MRIECPCGERFEADGSLQGRQVRCPSCGTSVPPEDGPAESTTAIGSKPSRRVLPREDFEKEDSRRGLVRKKSGKDEPASSNAFVWVILGVGVVGVLGLLAVLLVILVALPFTSLAPTPAPMVSVADIPDDELELAPEQVPPTTKEAKPVPVY